MITAMTKPEMIRADEVRFYLDDVCLPGRTGVYRAIPHDRADRAGLTLFVSINQHYIYIKDDMLVQKRQTN